MDRSGEINRIFIVAVIFISLILSIFFVLGAHITTYVDGASNTTIKEDISTRLNVSINNTNIGVAANNTEVNFTLPSSFTFTNGTNISAASAETIVILFTNTSNLLSFYNYTYYVVNGTNISYFSFNVTPSTPGAYVINITVLNITGVYNNSLNITVNDTTAPSNIQFVSPSPTNQTNLSRNFINLNLTATDNGNINTIGLFLFNSTRQQINVSFGTSSPSSINFTNLSDGVYSFNATVNDSAGNSNNTGTSTVTLDTANPNITYISPTPASQTNQSSRTFTINVSANDTNIGIIRFELHNSTGLYNRTDFSTSSPAYQSINYSALPDGNYKFNVTVNDSAGNSNTTATRNITIDATAPSLSQFVSPTPTNQTNLSRNFINLNLTATDTNINTIGLFLYNSTGQQINVSFGTSSPSSINFTNLSDGVYSFNATVNDSAGNSNNTGTSTVTLDRTNPLISYALGGISSGTTVAASSIYVNISVTETNEGFIRYELHNSAGLYNGTVLSSGNRSFRFSAVADGTYKINVTVNDTSGNSNTTSDITGIVVSTATPASSSSSGGGDGGGSQAPLQWVSTIFDNDKDLSSIGTINKVLGEREKIVISIDKKDHYVGVIKNGINQNSVTIEIASTPQQATLIIGDEKKFDVNGDGYYDIDIKLNGIKNGKADLTIKSIHEKVIAATVNNTKEESAPNVAQNELPATKGNNVWLYVIIIVLVGIVGIVYYIKKRKG